MKPEEEKTEKQIYSTLPNAILASDPVFGAASSGTALSRNRFATTANTDQGLWAQITDDDANVYKTPRVLLEERVAKLELDNKLLRLKILGMEGKFTQEEMSNIRKMLTAEDEASKALAESIIENA